MPKHIPNGLRSNDLRNGEYRNEASRRGHQIVLRSVRNAASSRVISPDDTALNRVSASSAAHSSTRRRDRLAAVCAIRRRRRLLRSRSFSSELFRMIRSTAPQRSSMPRPRQRRAFVSPRVQSPTTRSVCRPRRPNLAKPRSGMPPKGRSSCRYHSRLSQALAALAKE
jgi:hypothetical protein